MRLRRVSEQSDSRTTRTFSRTVRRESRAVRNMASLLPEIFETCSVIPFANNARRATRSCEHHLFEIIELRHADSKSLGSLPRFKVCQSIPRKSWRKKHDGWRRVIRRVVDLQPREATPTRRANMNGERTVRVLSSACSSTRHENSSAKIEALSIAHRHHRGTSLRNS